MRTRGGIAVILLAFVGVLAVFCLIAGGCAVSGYNKAIGLSERVSEQWAQVETVLQRRYDLIPNLVQTVKGYAKHENEIFTQIAKSRERYFSAGTREAKIEASAGMERALSRLLMLSENYPELKAQQSFLALQDELAGTENRIRNERRKYNEAVRALNEYTRQFFGHMFTSWAGVGPAEYFESEDAAASAPKVSFDDEKPDTPEQSPAP